MGYAGGLLFTVVLILVGASWLASDLWKRRRLRAAGQDVAPLMRVLFWVHVAIWGSLLVALLTLLIGGRFDG